MSTALATAANTTTLLQAVLTGQRELLSLQDRLLRTLQARGASDGIAAAGGCTLVAFRHVEKTGGASVREWMLRQDRQGRARFYGQTVWIRYKGRCRGWQQCCRPSDPRPAERCEKVPLKIARKLALDELATGGRGARHPLTMMEFHWPDSGLGQPNGPYTYLDLVPMMRSLPCRTLLVTVVRDPPPFYISLQMHQYGAWRPLAPAGSNLTACDFEAFPAIFPNVQAHRLTSRKWVPPSLSAVSHDEMLSRAAAEMRRFDVVGVTSELDRWVQLVCARAGIAACPALKRINRAKPGRQTYMCTRPPPETLRAVTRRHALADHRLHEAAAQRLRQDWEAMQRSGGAAATGTTGTTGATGATLGPGLAGTATPPPTPTTPPASLTQGRCGLLLFLHIEKTAGSTVVKMLEEREKRRELLFFNQGCGFHQFASQFMEGFRSELGLPHGGTPDRRLRRFLRADAKLASLFASRHTPCQPPLPQWRRNLIAVQFHGKVPLMYFQDEILPMLAALRSLYKAAGCPLVVFTLLREPVAREISFYRFFRQGYNISIDEWLEHDCTTTACSGYGKWRQSGAKGEGFWGRDNVQTRALLGWPFDADHSGWCGGATVAQAQKVLEQIDVVGTQSDFEPSLLLLWEALRLPPATAVTLGARQMYRQSYSWSRKKWLLPNLPAPLVAKLRNVTMCDKALFEASKRRLSDRIKAAPRDDSGRRFRARLRELLARPQQEWDWTHGMAWTQGALCTHQQPALYTTARYDPVCNRSWVMPGAGGFYQLPWVVDAARKKEAARRAAPAPAVAAPPEQTSTTPARPTTPSGRGDDPRGGRRRGHQRSWAYG